MISKIIERYVNHSFKSRNVFKFQIQLQNEIIFCGMRTILKIEKNENRKHFTIIF